MGGFDTFEVDEGNLNMNFPKVKEDLIIQAVGNEETLVCDTAAGKVHVLNKVSQAVFEACRDQVSGEDADAFFAERDAALNEQEISQALDGLRAAGLLEEGAAVSTASSRRQFLVAASIAAPAILSLSLPAPVAANSNTSFTPCTCTGIYTSLGQAAATPGGGRDICGACATGVGPVCPAGTISCSDPAVSAGCAGCGFGFCVGAVVATGAACPAGFMNRPLACVDT